MMQFRRRQRGVSLIEALVAFAVMAFGMMAVVGMQATLRSNADLARQRAEALRIAQDYIEEWRAFSVWNADPDRTAYRDLITAPAEVDIAGTNATYKMTRAVPLEAAVPDTVAPQRRTVVVEVRWKDRADQDQLVRLSSVVAGVEPELTASSVLAANLGDPVIAPGGRHRAIPPAAVRLPSGGSGFVPPGQTGVRDIVVWVFDHTTGVVTICKADAVTVSADLLVAGVVLTCPGGKDVVAHRVLSGVVRFATAGVPDTTANPTLMADPQGPTFLQAWNDFQLKVVQRLPDLADVQGLYPHCYLDPLANAQIVYYCAVPVGAAVTWSGTMQFLAASDQVNAIAPPVGLPSDIGFSHDVNDFNDKPGPLAEQGLWPRYKVCRYFNNGGFPETYTDVNGARINQNYVVIKAGDGVNPYKCPDPDIKGKPRTWPHQPRP